MTKVGDEASTWGTLWRFAKKYKPETEPERTPGPVGTTTAVKFAGRSSASGTNEKHAKKRTTRYNVEAAVLGTIPEAESELAESFDEARTSGTGDSVGTAEGEVADEK